MTEFASYSLDPIGIVRSPIRRLEESPMQGLEGAPEAWLEIFPHFFDGLEGITPGCGLVVLTWLHLARRDLLKVHPRHNLQNPLTGVFATRSPSRPNPIGLHAVKVLEIDRQRGVRVDRLEVVDGTPVIDIKPALSKLPNG